MSLPAPGSQADINSRRLAAMARRDARLAEHDKFDKKDKKDKGFNEPVRGPITQPGPVTEGPRVVRDVGFGNGPRGMGNGLMATRGTGVLSSDANTDLGKQMIAEGKANVNNPYNMKKGGKVKSTSAYKSGGKVSSASKRGDGCAQRGKTKGKMV